MFTPMLIMHGPRNSFVTETLRPPWIHRKLGLLAARDFQTKKRYLNSVETIKTPEHLHCEKIIAYCEERKHLH